MAKAIPLDLTRDVVYSYDQTKTTLLGRALKKTLTAPQGGKTVVGTPLNVFGDVISDSAITPTRVCETSNGHKLYINTSTAAGLITAVLYDVDSQGVETYVGKRQFQLPATTHTPNGLRLLNDSGSTNWRILVTTIGAVAASGGLFSFEMTDKADFVQGLPGTHPVATAAGQKAVYWHQETGGTNNLTVSRGIAHAYDAGLSTGELIVPHNVVATPQFYKFDTSLSITTVGGGGVTTDWFVFKTGVITGMVGTFLLLNNYSLCIPSADSMAPVALQGQLCLFIPTSSNMGLCLVSDITNGGTTLANYTTRDLNDVANTNVALTPATMHFSQTLQRIIFQMNNGSFVVKKFVNASYEIVFGNSSNSQYRTLQPIPFFEFGGTSITSTFERDGWLATVNATTGQIGGMRFDLRSANNFDYSAIISKVIKVPRSTFVSISVQAPLRSFGKFFYRQSGFGVATGGWTAIATDRDMTPIPNTTGEIQLKFQPRFERDGSTVPLQIIESHLITQPNDENDAAWRGDARNIVQTSPARTAFSQVDDYTGSKHWEFFAYRRDTGALVVQANTQANAADFELSTNDGSTYGSVVGAIASSKFLNVLRYKWSSPPGFEVDCSLREKV